MVVGSEGLSSKRVNIPFSWWPTPKISFPIPTTLASATPTMANVTLSKNPSAQLPPVVTKLFFRKYSSSSPFLLPAWGCQTYFFLFLLRTHFVCSITCQFPQTTVIYTDVYGGILDTRSSSPADGPIDFNITTEVSGRLKLVAVLCLHCEGL